MFLIFLWMQFLFVTAVPKYLSFATFSKKLLAIRTLYDFSQNFGSKI
jgi:hypothetical protein